MPIQKISFLRATNDGGGKDHLLFTNASEAAEAIGKGSAMARCLIENAAGSEFFLVEMRISRATARLERKQFGLTGQLLTHKLRDHLEGPRLYARFGAKIIATTHPKFADSGRFENVVVAVSAPKAKKLVRALPAIVQKLGISISTRCSPLPDVLFASSLPQGFLRNELAA